MLVLRVAVAGAASGPRPPCGEPPIPAFPSNDASPTVGTWSGDELRRLDWRAAACLSWSGPTHQVAALAGKFRSSASLKQLLARIAAVSRYSSIPYWSASAQSWRPLAQQAWAVDGMKGTRPRPDYSAGDLASGAPLFYAEKDARTGVVVYRMRVTRLTAGHATISIENASPIRLFFLLRLFDPHALQTEIFLDRLSPGLWGVYEITRATQGMGILAGGHLDSYANRETAVFRYLSGETGRTNDAANGRSDE